MRFHDAAVSGAGALNPLHRDGGFSAVIAGEKEIPRGQQGNRTQRVNQK